MNINLGEQLRTFRRREGRTQEDLANAIGVTAQAVSRWEKNVCYPDMELIPSIANYFGVSIDELFGYQGERASKIDGLISEIEELNKQNNGTDVCLDQCIRLAREGLWEFPGNEKLMLCLASLLYNAGYARYGECYLTDAEGFRIFDTERHKSYAEWQEAIKLYEKLISTLEAGDMRNEAMTCLVRLYVNSGEMSKARSVAMTASELYGCKEFLMINTYSGAERRKAFGEAILKTVESCADLMISVTTWDSNLPPLESVQIIRSVVSLFGLAIPDGNLGLYNAYISRIYLYLSQYLWMTGDKDEAFEALYDSLRCAKEYDALTEQEEISFTAPLISMIKRYPESEKISGSLLEDWPWWSSPHFENVKSEMTADPRWNEWVSATRE